MNGLLNYIFPITGGTTGSMIYGIITAEGTLQVIVYAAIGAFIGSLVGFGMSYIKKKLKK